MHKIVIKISCTKVYVGGLNHYALNYQHAAEMYCSHCYATLSFFPNYTIDTNPLRKFRN